MRVDFNGNGFFAEMGSSQPQPTQPQENEIKIKGIKHVEVLTLGILAVIFALILVPMGIIVNLGVDALKIIQVSTTNYVVMFAFIAIVLFALSMTLATIACLLHRKGEKNNISLIGFIMSIIAYVVGSIAIIYNILGIILHFHA